MISYGGVELTFFGADLAAWVEQHISLSDLVQFMPSPSLKHYVSLLPYPNPWERKVKMDSLWWPQGAARWSTCHCFITESQRNLINATVYDSGYNQAELIYSDGTNSLTTNMWMLPPRPLAQVAPDAASQLKWILPNIITGGQPAYLMTLVDDRYFWWQRSGSVTLTPGTTTWADLLTDIASALDVTITNDTIPSAYLKPPMSLVNYVECLPVLLDMVAFSTGLRVVVGYDGTVNLQNATNALASVTSQVAATTNRCAGGLISLDFATGPTICDQPPLIPGSVKAVFQDVSNAPPHTVTVPMGSAGLSSSLFNASVSPNDNVCPVQSIQPYDGTNGTALATLATQLAFDYYMWQMGRLDMVFRGVLPWTPEGTSDSVEIQESGIITTRVQRGVWYDFLDIAVANAGITVTDINNTYTNVTNVTIIGGTIITGPGTGGGITIPPGGLGVNIVGDIDSMRETGLPDPNGTIYTPLTASGVLTGMAGGTKVPTNQIFAIPLIVPSGRTIKELCLYIWSYQGPTDTFPGGDHSNDKYQLAAYAGGSDGSFFGQSQSILYPQSSLIDTGDVYPYTVLNALGLSAGWIRTSVSPTAIGPGVVWLCINASNDDYDPTVPASYPTFEFGTFDTGLMNILGYTSSQDPDPLGLPIRDVTVPYTWLANYPHNITEYAEEGAQDPAGPFGVFFTGGVLQPAADPYGSWPTMPAAPHLQKYNNQTGAIPAIGVVFAD